MGAASAGLSAVITGWILNTVSGDRVQIYGSGGHLVDASSGADLTTGGSRCHTQSQNNLISGGVEPFPALVGEKHRNS